MFFKIAKSHQIFKLLLSEFLPPKAFKIAQLGQTDFNLPNIHIQLPRLAWSQPTRCRERSRSPRRPRKTPSPSGRPQGLDMSGMLLKDAQVLRYAYKDVPIGKGTWLVRVTILGLDMSGILLKITFEFKCLSSLTKWVGKYCILGTHRRIAQTIWVQRY